MFLFRANGNKCKCCLVRTGSGGKTLAARSQGTPILLNDILLHRIVHPSSDDAYEVDVKVDWSTPLDTRVVRPICFCNRPHTVAELGHFSSKFFEPVKFSNFADISLVAGRRTAQGSICKISGASCE